MLRSAYRKLRHGLYGVVVPAIALVLVLAFSFENLGGVDLSISRRLAFWFALVAASLMIARISIRYVENARVLSGRAIKDVAVVLMFMVLFTPWLWISASLVFSYADGTDPMFTTVTKFGALFAIGLVVVRRGLVEAQTMPDETPEPAKPRLYRRLPEAFGGDILRLTATDHCVEVVTSEGTHTIRIRFGDAIDEMDPVPGYCAHRSHWVTSAAIQSSERRNGKIVLRLTNGDLVPVGRKYRPNLEAAGIL